MLFKTQKVNNFLSSSVHHEENRFIKISYCSIIDPFDANNLLQTLILVLGFLSLANILVNLWFGSVSRQALTSESQSVLAQPLPQGRMLDTMTQVFNAINTIEQKYFEHVN